MYKQKGFIPILIAILVAVVIAGGAFYLGRQTSKHSNTQTPIQTTTKTESTTTPITSTPSPTPNETANWKTYTNSQAKYSINYLHDWIIKEENVQVDSSSTHTTLQSKDYVIGQPEMGGGFAPGVSSGEILDIVISQNPNFNSYEQYRDFSENVATDRSFYSTKQEITVTGVKAMLKLGGKPYKGFQSECYFFKNGKIYQIVFKSSDNQDLQFKQILSTFKFTQ